MSTSTTTAHALHFEKETRPLPPDVGNWKHWGATGRARTTCTCGLDTGWVRTAEAVRIGKEHQDDTSTCEHPAPTKITAFDDPEPVAYCTGCGSNLVLDDDGEWVVPGPSEEP